MSVPEQVFAIVNDEVYYTKRFPHDDYDDYDDYDDTVCIAAASLSAPDSGSCVLDLGDVGVDLLDVNDVGDFALVATNGVYGLYVVAIIDRTKKIRQLATFQNGDPSPCGATDRYAYFRTGPRPGYTSGEKPCIVRISLGGGTLEQVYCSTDFQTIDTIVIAGDHAYWIENTQDPVTRDALEFLVRLRVE